MKAVFKIFASAFNKFDDAKFLHPSLKASFFLTFLFELLIWTLPKKERCYSEEIKKQAIKLYMEGNSGKAVERILGMSKNMCLYWIKNTLKK